MASDSILGYVGQVIAAEGFKERMSSYPNLYLRLFTEVSLPLSCTAGINAYVQPLFNGYSERLIPNLGNNFDDPQIQDDTVYLEDPTPFKWVVLDAPAEEQVVSGWVLFSPDFGVLAAYKFAQPVSMRAPGDTLEFKLRIVFACRCVT